MPDNRQIEDTQILAEIQDYARQLESDHAQRLLDAEDYERMYLMNWIKKDDPAFKQQRVTIETTPRDAVEGATRLMIAEEPIWQIEQEDTPQAELIETELGRWWNASGHAARQPHEHDLVRSGLLYASMDAAITPTAELLAYARKGKNKPTIAEAEALAERTPWLVDVWNPRQGFPAWDIFGLAAYYRKTEMTVHDAESRFGPLPEDLSRGNRYKNVTVNLFYDREWYALWIGQYPVTCKKHKLPMIPIMSQIVDGSMLFDKPEFQRQPILYTLLKSGLWDSMNVYLTTAFTAILAMGTVGKWLHTAPPGSPGKKLDMDWSTFVIELEQGESLQPLLAKGLLDPDAAGMYQLASAKAEQATLYKQAFGAPLNKGNTTFSEISLLSQAGRLPLIGTQKKGGWGIAQLGYMMLQWGREKPEYLRHAKIKATDIPKYLDVASQLKIKLPQDELQNANLARMLSTGDDPLTTKAWTREHILGIGQPEKMQQEIWDERGAELMWMTQIQQIQQQMQQAMAEAEARRRQAMAGRQQFANPGIPPGGPPNATPVAPPPNAPPPGPAPSAGPMMPPGQAEGIEGIPPQMAGTLPGMGQGTIPPGTEDMMEPPL